MERANGHRSEAVFLGIYLADHWPSFDRSPHLVTRQMKRSIMALLIIMVLLVSISGILSLGHLLKLITLGHT